MAYTFKSSRNHFGIDLDADERLLAASKSNKKDVRVAYHEAGHVVAAVVVGLSPHSASIVPDIDTDGRVRHKKPFHGINLEVDNSDRARLRVERNIIICFAGPSAQRKHQPRSWRTWHGQTDFETAVDLAGRVSGSDAEADAFLKWLNERAVALVNFHWESVERVATALLARRTLNAAEIKHIVRNCEDLRRA
jgi:ATP-dependent Zn protease